MTTESARIRAKLDHPLIDGDSHIIEYTPVLMEYFKAAGGEQAVADFGAQMGAGRSAGWYQMTDDERRYHRTMRAPWWALPTKNTYDRCTAMLPKLYHERMDDFGHWDVTDMDQAAAEAYEQLEDGLIDADDFRKFAFGFSVQLYAAPNPGFFDGTRIEQEARDELAKVA